jgi:polyphenol oxidase
MVLLLMVKMEQVHGNKVVFVDRKSDGKTIKNCDGLITNLQGLSLSVRVADCLPIFFSSPTIDSIGLVHAGWRGLYKGIIGKTVKMFSEKPFVFIGPHICQKHYEIKSDVAEKFKEYPKAIKKIKGKIFLDLGEVAKEQLMASGVKKNKIKIDKTCTFEDKSLDSFRRGDLNKRTEYIFSLPDSS